ncbi:hypothetical protein TVAG_339170 [Trichomonas vaginalis G3]|uniref:Uncharacterized protein n=1 Tax=Trichomonas vaginalis (strain ATCC PRA-98 / G3) TaxID=412133 RepID=A2FMT0_TRIV3|nr:hypothetical protein TVAGG3_0300320 [Trichomonas vaginalis G3]EAX93794.1 hypothetical protein TVAG_339170 [Trichomonas vaginalis G3]KAI5527841.1 hypothetical protein TVAGG3_0300320 [Trichomonas vaginalis G3]|eukprot:XP_001306724.1 hypothetical protein [Trichomonas vaginalis G3]
MYAQFLYVYGRMKKKEDLSGLSQRKTEKAIFERKQIIALQDEEIARLKDEHFMLLRQIQTTENHFVKVNKLYNERTTKLRDNIQSISAKRIHSRIQLYKSHTDQITKLRTEHQAALKNIQIEYDQKMKEEKEKPITLKADGRQTSVEVIAESINRINTLTQQALQEKEANKNEIIEKRLTEYKTHIENYRQKELDLRQQIQNAQFELEEARKRNEIRIEEAKELAQKRALRNEQTAAKTDDLMIMQRANNVSRLNEIRVNEIQSLENLKADLNEAKKKVFELKTKITDANVSEIRESKKAQESVDKLVIQLDSLNNQDIATHIQQYAEKEKEEKRKMHKIKKSLESLVNQRDLLIKDNSRLRDEIRRIDFMLYGRNGIHQIQKSSRKRPFVPVAAH